MTTVKTVALTSLLALLLVGQSLARPRTATAAGADETKPVAVVSIAGYDAIMKDIGLIGKLANQPEAVQQIDTMLKMFTQGQGVKGLDVKRPWGAAISTDDQNSLIPLVFIPVSDLKQLLTS